MFRKSKTLICAVAFLLFCFCIPFESNAAISTSNSFYVEYPQPTADEFSGFFIVSYWNSSASRYVTCGYVWRLTPGFQNATHAGYDIEVRMNINYSNGVLTFTPWTAGSTTTVVQMGYFDADDSYHVLKNSTSVSNGWSYSDNYSNFPIQGYIYGGNIGYINGLSDSETPVIHFTNSVDAIELYNLLNATLNKITQIEGDTSTLINKATDIYNQNVATNQKLDDMNALLEEIKAEQEESNTWLEKIFNWLKDSPEQEKQEATTQGNQSTSDATTAITDNSQGFIDSLGGLANSMSYSGTDCAWTFPAITLPAIPGVMDSMQLTTDKPIDFSYWVNQIPENLLLLIQSLLTIALIIYCFKEVYGTISYVLTLRGGGNNE